MTTLVLVDTPVWSLALRRKPADLNPGERDLTQTLAQLVREGRAQISGPVRQELLSGIREFEGFAILREHLHAFDEPRLEIGDYETAAEMNNKCRRKGIAGSAVDFLICAIASRRNWPVLTTDRDFDHYSRVLSIKLYA